MSMGRMYVILNGEPLEEVDYFRHLGWQVGWQVGLQVGWQVGCQEDLV